MPPIASPSSSTLISRPFRRRDIVVRTPRFRGKNEKSAEITSSTCRRCKQRFNPADNHDQACSYHPCNWSGGEKAKALGFLRESADPADSLSARLGTGTLRFWDCCGADVQRLFYSEVRGGYLGSYSSLHPGNFRKDLLLADPYADGAFWPCTPQCS